MSTTNKSDISTILKMASSQSQPQPVPASSVPAAVDDLFLPLGRQLFVIVAYFNERGAISFRVCNTSAFNGKCYPTKKGEKKFFFHIFLCM